MISMVMMIQSSWKHARSANQIISKQLLWSCQTAAVELPNYFSNMRHTVNGGNPAALLIRICSPAPPQF